MCHSGPLQHPKRWVVGELDIVSADARKGRKRSFAHDCVKCLNIIDRKCRRPVITKPGRFRQAEHDIEILDGRAGCAFAEIVETATSLACCVLSFPKT